MPSFVVRGLACWNWNESGQPLCRHRVLCLLRKIPDCKPDGPQGVPHPAWVMASTCPSRISPMVPCTGRVDSRWGRIGASDGSAKRANHCHTYNPSTKDLSLKQLTTKHRAPAGTVDRMQFMNLLCVKSPTLSLGCAAADKRKCFLPAPASVVASVQSIDTPNSPVRYKGRHSTSMPVAASADRQCVRRRFRSYQQRAHPIACEAAARAR